MQDELEPEFMAHNAPSPAPLPATTGEASTWLIERGQAANHVPTIWWCGGDKRAGFGEDEMKNWTEDASRARRFTKYEDAKELARKLFGDGSYLVTEHVFLAGEAKGATVPTCGLCGEPMPPGEEMFKFHGYSGDCPKPSMVKVGPLETPEETARAHHIVLKELVKVKRELESVTKERDEYWERRMREAISVFFNKDKADLITQLEAATRQRDSAIRGLNQIFGMCQAAGIAPFQAPNSMSPANPVEMVRRTIADRDSAIKSLAEKTEVALSVGNNLFVYGSDAATKEVQERLQELEVLRDLQGRITFSDED